MIFKGGERVKGKGFPEIRSRKFDRTINDMVKAAKASKLRNRDPELHKEFVEEVTKSHPPVQRPPDRKSLLLLLPPSRLCSGKEPAYLWGMSPKGRRQFTFISIDKSRWRFLKAFSFLDEEDDLWKRWYPSAVFLPNDEVINGRPLNGR
jgi:hypothetical protein